MKIDYGTMSNEETKDEAEFLKRIPGFTLDDYDIVVEHVKEKWRDLAKGKGDDKDPIIILSEVCEEYPDCCDFCDYNCSGWCSLYCADVPSQEEE